VQMIEEAVARAEQRKLMSNIGPEVQEHRKRRTRVAAEMKQAAATQEIDIAYAEFMKMTKGTPEYDQSLGGFISLLFPKNRPHRA
jgi:hypothetical protein